MKLTDGEKLITIMLSDLYEKLGIDGEIDPKFIKSAIFSENIWAIGWKYPGLPFENDSTPEIVREVSDILDMWFVIEESYAALSPKDKKLIEKEAKPFGKEPKFKGFDGNNESDYMSVANFLTDDLERFQTFKDRMLNSHMPSVGTYCRMLNAFKPINSQSMGNLLNATQLIAVLKEKIHPENR